MLLKIVVNTDSEQILPKNCSIYLNHPRNKSEIVLTSIFNGDSKVVMVSGLILNLVWV